MKPLGEAEYRVLAASVPDAHERHECDSPLIDVARSLRRDGLLCETDMGDFIRYTTTEAGYRALRVHAAWLGSVS